MCVLREGTIAVCHKESNQAMLTKYSIQGKLLDSVEVCQDHIAEVELAGVACIALSNL